MARIAGVVLGAGAGSRMGQPKAEVLLGGVRLLDRAVSVLIGAGCSPVYAVVRAGSTVDGATAIVNDDPDRGMRSSLQLAVTACAGVDAMAVLLVDMPGVRSDAVRAVVGAWVPGRIATAVYPGGRRGHPIVMAPQLWAAAVAAGGPDEGARAYLRSRPDLLDEVPVAGRPDDLDTPDDLAHWSD